MSLDPAIKDLIERQAITETLYRYASTIDAKDFLRLRSLFVDDVTATFADVTTLDGADNLVAWIDEMTKDRSWQHHLLSVYHIELDGDHASALTYHTSHQTAVADPDSVIVLVARYHDTLRKVDGVWKIASKVMKVGWREERHFPQSPKA